jgi:exonuclease VII small subunit
MGTEQSFETLAAQLRQAVTMLENETGEAPEAGDDEGEEYIDVNLETLALVFQEGREAHHRLMTEIDTLSQRAERSVQLSFLIIGIVAAFGTTIIRDLPESWNSVALFLFVGAVINLISVAIIVPVTLLFEFYAGTQFPHELFNESDLPPNEMQVRLIKSYAESYYNNYQNHLKRARWIITALWVQYLGIGAIGGAMFFALRNLLSG